MSSDVKRATRVAEAVHQELADLINLELSDPRVSGVVVSRVLMSDDLRTAKIYVRILVGSDDRRRRATAVEGLSRAANLLRREVTRRVRLRYAPELSFFYDEEEDNRARIEQILMEIKNDEHQGH